MNNSHTPEDRTTPLGLFNYARSYWRSSEQLRVSKVDVSHPDAPILFLFYHAVELYLKAYVRSAGYDLQQLKEISHKIIKGGLAAQSLGLQLTAHDFDLLALVDSHDNVVRSRYITTGAYTRPEVDELSTFCEFLDKAVGERLIADGHSVSAKAFGPPLAPSMKKTVEEHLSEEIETLSKKERAILAYLLHHRQRVFTCAADGGHAVTLISRGIVRHSLRSGQVFDYDDMPVEIPTEVWRFLRARIDKFPYEEEEDAPFPWRKGWME